MTAADEPSLLVMLAVFAGALVLLSFACAALWIVHHVMMHKLLGWWSGRPRTNPHS